MITQRQAYKDFYKDNSKSQYVSALLTVGLGPIGLFYSNVLLALVLTALAAITWITVVGPVVCWALSIGCGYYSVEYHNEEVKGRLAACMLAGIRS